MSAEEKVVDEVPLPDPGAIREAKHPQWGTLRQFLDGVYCMVREGKEVPTEELCKGLKWFSNHYASEYADWKQYVRLSAKYGYGGFSSGEQK